MEPETAVRWCDCDEPDQSGRHELSATCYVWYKLKVKYRGVANAGSPIIRVPDGFEIKGDK